ncbi:DNA-binding domain-containing protein [Rhizobium sp. CNPSo 4039]|uniref:HvfC/BufC N-terminal domain-containing protein n=1 Tax=Rhizobium sp. CNPSo 4039 TaxID=3021409 RepID=UPI00255161FA|nr:DNA-binding domain-containing protein [Rhizobium sp. CNPSo 4039]MDK4713659.1 DNA-binding domain-containing protein [Rhizobium sp. CNPSo 4039]
MSLATQSKFAAALIDPDLAVPDGLTAWNGRQPARRFGVYRNNVAIGLIGALASRFPAAERIVGEEFFAAMAHEFIRMHPPRSPLLLAYGDDFPDFAGSFEPAQEIPYLADVMRLEALRGRAYHAADAIPLDAALMATIEPAGLAELTFVPHPSASVARSAYPAITIWAMNTGEIELADINDWTGEDALVIRPQMIVEVHRLPPGGATFLEELFSGAALGQAYETALAEAANFDLSANLAGAFTAGAFMAIR